MKNLINFLLLLSALTINAQVTTTNVFDFAMELSNTVISDDGKTYENVENYKYRAHINNHKLIINTIEISNPSNVITETFVVLKSKRTFVSGNKVVISAQVGSRYKTYEVRITDGPENNQDSLVIKSEDGKNSYKLLTNDNKAVDKLDKSKGNPFFAQFNYLASN